MTPIEEQTEKTDEKKSKPKKIGVSSAFKSVAGAASGAAKSVSGVATGAAKSVTGKAKALGSKVPMLPLLTGPKKTPKSKIALLKVRNISLNLENECSQLICSALH